MNFCELKSRYKKKIHFKIWNYRLILVLFYFLQWFTIHEQTNMRCNVFSRSLMSGSQCGLEQYFLKGSFLFCQVIQGSIVFLKFPSFLKLYVWLLIVYWPGIQSIIWWNSQFQLLFQTTKCFIKPKFCCYNPLALPYNNAVEFTENILSVAGSSHTL